jgi:hypothetical protein
MFSEQLSPFGQSAVTTHWTHAPLLVSQTFPVALSAQSALVWQRGPVLPSWRPPSDPPFEAGHADKASERTGTRGTRHRRDIATPPCGTGIKGTQEMGRPYHSGPGSGKA